MSSSGIFVQHYFKFHMLSFALLDDSDSNDKQPTSRLYTDLQNVLSFNNSAQFLLMTEQMQDALRTGLYAVAVFSYELGVELQGLNVAEANLREFAAQPSFVLLYQQCQRLSPDEVTDWLREREDWSNNIAGIADLHASVNQEEFTQAIDRIQRYIVEGDIYQANYTFRFYFHTYGSIFSLYQSLRKRQPVPFGALISMPDGSAVLSLSPELFIHHSQGNLLTRPMKGTAAALVTTDDKLNEEINLQRCEQLSQDEKNRAENVMIVDLLRNDLGRIAQPGSIQVPKLFEVRRFNTVLQMTSSVTARSRNDLKLVDLLKAIYPCGSITGAPKIRAMQIINEVETEPRGIYTGAIGWFDPMHFQPDERNKIPEFCLSVPIRTLHLQAPISGGIRHGVMGVGAGIVLDSVADIGIGI
ncbi:MAG: pabB [Solimicrobium sp.]|nr:pabB [Solimicrobium sp.]